MTGSNIRVLVLLLFALSISSFGQVPELPLPKVPKELREPKARAVYILTHFWDGMDFCDTLRSRDRAFMEQNFSNFLSLFPHADSSVLPGVVKRLMEHSAVDGKANGLLADIAERYLDGHDSPMRNEGYFILFLEAQMENRHLDEGERSRLEFLLAAAKKNRPGTVAADFSFTLRNGKTERLHQLKADRILVYFNDPECEDCRRVKEILNASAVLDEELAAGRLILLSVCVEGKTAAWEAARLPEGWLDAYDEGQNLTRQGVYDLKKMPTLYLLDGDKRVLLKDTTVEEIENLFK